MGARGPRERTDTTAQELQLAFVDLDHLTIAPEALRCIPAYLARGRLVMPVKRDGHILWIAVGDVNDVDTMDRVREFSGCRVIPVVVERDALERAVQRYYPIR
jgi:type IV pilus assembly protein PilB